MISTPITPAQAERADTFAVISSTEVNMLSLMERETLHQRIADMCARVDERDRLRARVAELEKQHAAVFVLHRKHDDPGHCVADDETWPCDSRTEKAPVEQWEDGAAAHTERQTTTLTRGKPMSARDDLTTYTTTRTVTADSLAPYIDAVETEITASARAALPAQMPGGPQAYRSAQAISLLRSLARSMTAGE